MYHVEAEPVQQVTAKQVFGRSLQQVHIGCGDHPHIGAQGLLAAQPFEFPVLHDTQ